MLAHRFAIIGDGRSKVQGVCACVLSPYSVPLVHMRGLMCTRIRYVMASAENSIDVWLSVVTSASARGHEGYYIIIVLCITIHSETSLRPQSRCVYPATNAAVVIGLGITYTHLAHRFTAVRMQGKQH